MTKQQKADIALAADKAVAAEVERIEASAAARAANVRLAAAEALVREKVADLRRVAHCDGLADALRAAVLRNERARRLCCGMLRDCSAEWCSMTEAQLAHERLQNDYALAVAFTACGAEEASDA